MTWCDIPSKITGCTISASPARFDALHENLPLSVASGTFTINSCVPSAWSKRWYFGSSFSIRTQSLYHSIVGRGTPWTCVSSEISLIFKWYPSTKIKIHKNITQICRLNTYVWGSGWMLVQSRRCARSHTLAKSKCTLYHCPGCEQSADRYQSLREGNP